MVTTAGQPEDDEVVTPTEKVVDAAYFAAEHVDAAFRGLVGDRAGRLRRPLLFALVGVALVLNVPALGILALLLLAYTDEVGEVDDGS